MADPIIPAEINPIIPAEGAPKEESSLLDGDKKPDGSILDDASKKAEEVKVAEEDRLLGIKDEDLSVEDKPKKEAVVKLRKEAKDVSDAKVAEEKRLLETKDEDLSAEDKTKKEALVKAGKETEEAKKVREAAEKPPEKYELKMPEGMTLNQATLDKVSPMFKELGLNNEKAQKVADAYIEIRKAEATAQETAFNKFVADLKTETITALGADYKKEMSFAAKVKERFFSPGTVDKLNSSGLANDKDLILDLIKIGRVISEDKLVEGEPGKGAALTGAEKMYGKDK